MAEHIHWKKAFNPNYFGGWCFDEGKDMVLTIADVKEELVTGEKGAQEMCLVVHWKEPGAKPLICNKTNGESIAKLVGSDYIDKWVDTPVQLYFDPSVKFGRERVGGVRIRPTKPTIKEKPILCTVCGKAVSAAEINGVMTAPARIAAAAQKRFGRVMCWDCVQAQNQSAEGEGHEADA